MKTDATANQSIREGEAIRARVLDNWEYKRRVLSIPWSYKFIGVNFYIMDRDDNVLRVVGTNEPFSERTNVEQLPIDFSNIEVLNFWRTLEKMVNQLMTEAYLKYLEDLVTEYIENGHSQICTYDGCFNRRGDGEEELECVHDSLHGTSSVCQIVYGRTFVERDIPEGFNIDWTIQDIDRLGYIPGWIEYSG